MFLCIPFSRYIGYGIAVYYFCGSGTQTQIWLVFVAQFIKSTGVIIATGYMWALVPEVISYGEYTHGKRISGIVNALTGIFYKAGIGSWRSCTGTCYGFCRIRPDK